MCLSRAMIKNKEGAVGFGGDEVEMLQVSGGPLESGARRLLQAVERFAQETNSIWLHRVDKAHRLLTEHLVRQMAMEKGVLDIELVYWPVARSREV